MIFSDRIDGWSQQLAAVLPTPPRVRGVYVGAVPSDWQLRSRRIADWHMLVVMRGRLWYGDPAAPTLRAPGSLLLVPPGVLHSGRTRGPVRFATCRFHASVGEVGHALVLPPEWSPRLGADWRRLHTAFRAAVTDLDHGVVDHLLTGLLIRVARAIERLQPDVDPDVHHVRVRVRADPEHPWTVDELAAERMISARELQRRCRAASGHGPKRLILEERHRAAESMLIDGLASVSEVAERFGFSESAAFSRSFSAVCGYPPSQCR